MPDLAAMLDAKQAVFVLAGRIDWSALEEDFRGYYSERGRPALPVRRMVGLLMLKQLSNLSDERVVEQWSQNPYFQYFCGETQFQWGAPCEASELVHFRNRIGPGGGERILAETVRLHGSQAQEKEVVVDTTAQPKNIAGPTDSGLYAKVIARCQRIARQAGVTLEVEAGEIRRLRLAQGGRRSAQGRKVAARATRRLKTLAKTALRSIQRLGPTVAPWRETLAVCQRVLRQKRHDHHKVYSLHEPQVYCMAREKTRTKYEFGAKAAVAMTPKGLIVGALSFDTNVHDNQTVQPLLAQIKRTSDCRPRCASGDRGFRGRQHFGSVRLHITQTGSAQLAPREKAAAHARYCRRAAIEPRLGHLKSDFRLGRNFLKGAAGDALNLLLAASASNLRLWIRNVWAALLLCLRSFRGFFSPNFQKAF